MALTDVPFLGGYLQQDQINRQNEAGGLNKLAQLMGLQKEALQNSVLVDSIERDKAIRDEIAKRRAAGASGQSGASIFSGGGSSPGSSARALAQQHFDIADIYEANGKTDQAMKMRDTGIKLMPELKEVTTEMRNGQPVRVMTYKDGTQEVSQFGAKPDVHWADTGGDIRPMDNLTGLPLQGATPITKTQTPDSVASNNTTIRGQNMTDARARESLAQSERHFNNPKPVFNADAGGFVFAPTKENPTGSVTQIPGLPGKPLTETQGNATAFALRAGQALKDLDSIKDADGKPFAPKASEFAAGSTPVAGNYLVSPKMQQFMNAEKNYIAAVLRKESGAAISKSEYDTYGPMFFPRPGDSEEVKAQKAEMRRLTEETLKIQAGPSYEQNAKKAGVTSQPGGLPKVTSDADYDKLPSGTQFVAPDGTTRRKP